MCIHITSLIASKISMIETSVTIPQGLYSQGTSGEMEVLGKVTESSGSSANIKELFLQSGRIYVFRTNQAIFPQF